MWFFHHLFDPIDVLLRFAVTFWIFATVQLPRQVKHFLAAQLTSAIRNVNDLQTALSTVRLQRNEK